MSITELRVLILIDELEIGGTQRQILELVRRLRQIGVRAALGYFRNRSALADEVQAAGCPVFEVRRHGRFDVGFPFRLARLMRSVRPDVIHAFSISAECWGALAHILCGRRGAFVSSIRGRYEWYSSALWHAKAVVSRLSEAVIANSAAGADYAVERGGARRNSITIVPNGIDLARFDAAAAADVSAAFGGVPPGRRIVFVGRLVDHKNLPCLLRALALPTTGDGNVHAFLVGDGPLLTSLQAQAESLNISDRVHWLGERNDIPALLKAADCLVLCSHREGLSNALIEAMAASLPVIATAVGGNVELVRDGHNGLLIGADDHEALAAAIGTMVRDPALRTRLGAAGRALIAASYSSESMANRFAQIYRKVA